MTKCKICRSTKFKDDQCCGCGTLIDDMPEVDPYDNDAWSWSKFKAMREDEYRGKATIGTPNSFVEMSEDRYHGSRHSRGEW